MLIFLLVRPDHGQLQELGADRQSRGSSHLRIDAKTHPLSFHEEINDASTFGEPVNLTDGENVPAANGLGDLADAVSFRRAHKQNLAGSGGGDVPDMANYERTAIYGLAIDDELECASERILAQHAYFDGPLLRTRGKRPLYKLHEIVKEGGFHLIFGWTFRSRSQGVRGCRPASLQRARWV